MRIILETDAQNTRKEIKIPKEFAEIMGIKMLENKQTVGFIYGVQFITY